MDDGVSFVKGMRESYPDVCWRLIANGERCCILDRGHDDGIHEERGTGAGRGVHPVSVDRRSADGSESVGREGRATDYGLQAQRAAEAHLAACQESLWGDEGVMTGEEPDSPASAPYCGCDTCIVREALFAAWPILLQAALDEVSIPLREIASSDRDSRGLRQIAQAALAAHHVDAEQEDQHQRGGDDQQTDVLRPERHG